jgi:hypothetical protein
MMEQQPQPNSDARRLAHEADALIAERERELAELREKREEIERHFHIAEAEQRAADARAAAEERHRLDAELTEAAEAMFAAIEQAQLHFQAAVDNVTAAIAANGRVRSIGREIAPHDKLSIGLALPDFVFRFGGRISAALRQVKVPGTLGTSRLGPLDLPEGGEFLAPKGDMSSAYDWRRDEERRQGHAINALLQHGRVE